jgi:hypothetical protein
MYLFKDWYYFGLVIIVYFDVEEEEESQMHTILFFSAEYMYSPVGFQETPHITELFCIKKNVNL